MEATPVFIKTLSPRGARLRESPQNWQPGTSKPSRLAHISQAPEEAGDEKMQIAVRATAGRTRARGAGAGRSYDLRRPPRPGFGKGPSPRFRLAAGAGQRPASFRGAGRADRIETRAFRRARRRRRRRTQVVFRPGDAAAALLYNNGAVFAGDAL